jgi:hypothetical protein
LPLDFFYEPAAPGSVKEINFPSEIKLKIEAHVISVLMRIKKKCEREKINGCFNYRGRDRR